MTARGRDWQHSLRLCWRREGRDACGHVDYLGDLGDDCGGGVWGREGRGVRDWLGGGTPRYAGQGERFQEAMWLLNRQRIALMLSSCTMGKCSE